MMTAKGRKADEKPSHSYLSCTEVARRLGLSRQRFWQLRRDGVFPEPQTDEESGRQYYTAEQVELCLDLRRRNVGMNGRVVLFYSARSTVSAAPRSTKKKSAQKTANENQPIIDALKSLGLSNVTDAEVSAVVKELFPIGKNEVALGDVVRAVFLHLQRKNSGDNVR